MAGVCVCACVQGQSAAASPQDALINSPRELLSQSPVLSPTPALRWGISPLDRRTTWRSPAGPYGIAGPPLSLAVAVVAAGSVLSLTLPPYALVPMSSVAGETYQLVPSGVHVTMNVVSHV